MVQRHYGLEDGSLLRWAVSPPQALIGALNTQFKCVYSSYEDLIPVSDGMVADEKSGLSFHTAMSSEIQDGTRVFVSNAVDRRNIYSDEFSKLCYLKDKLLRYLLSGEKIFVYNQSFGRLSADEIISIKGAVMAYNSNNLLLIVGEADNTAQIGKVEVAGAGLIYGYIDCFAPYDAVDNMSSFEVWNEIIEQTEEIYMQRAENPPIPTRADIPDDLVQQIIQPTFAR